MKTLQKILLRVSLSACDARCTSVQLRFPANIAAARDGVARSLIITRDCF
jgi:hypothetical protein